MQRLLRFQRQPPATCVGEASSSGRVAPVTATSVRPHWKANSRRLSHGSHRQHVLEPCRITSTAKELYQSNEAKEMNVEEDDGEEAYIDVPDYQVWEPEKGPLERRVYKSYNEAMKDDRIDLRDTEYWFSNPEGNWNSKPQRLHYMKEDEEPLVPSPYHDPEQEEGAEERIRYTELDEGRVLLGMVTDVWLYHGVQVDIGAEFDGLIPCSEELWELAVDHLDVGEVVMVEVHKLRTPGLYRWPIQLKFTVRGLQDLMLPPDDYHAPIDFGWAEANGWSLEEISEATGRSIDVPTYFIPPDGGLMAEQIQDGYGTGIMPWREQNSDPVPDYIDDPLPDPAEEAWLGERSGEVDAAADELLQGL
ncbi:hypothetical protein Agub_g13718 [Astrephomene gubernaculifera]|uniref:S1 motif domain-containing protein n=1 Tax=Astrephomene gubernaculifera TaxID=47775 RepID=A0AAD3E2I8_9CHLO|nr:hypothetical protein Agub_g13718 [Astrephomene gubernaculifera]